MGSTRSVNRFGPFLGLLGLAAIIGIGIGGCDQGAAAAGPFDDTAAAVSGGPLDAGFGAGPFAALTVEQIDARVKLTGEQRTAIESALDRAREARGERVARWGRGRHGRHAAAGRPRFDPAAGESPALVFLEDASKTLSPDQFAELARLLKEERDSWIAERPAARERIRAFRAGKRSQIKDAPTAGRREKADVFRAKRVGERIDARLARMEEQIQRRGAFLERVLDLTPDQARRVQELLKGTVSGRKEILTGVKAGTVPPEEAAVRVLDLERGVASQIGSLLTPEQTVRWDALRDLLPRGGPRRGF